MKAIAHTAFIINSFNRLDLLKIALKTATDVLGNTTDEYAFVVFEAGSNDGSAEYLRDYQADNPKIPLLICNDAADTSFSAGCNAGAKFAIDNVPGLKYLFFYETDNALKNPDALRLARALMQRETKMGALGFTVENHQGNKIGFGEGFPTYFQFILGQQMAEYWEIDAPKLAWADFGNNRWSFCDIVYTSPLLVKVEAWKATNGMDSTRFPFSDSDLDWAWRANKLGWRSAVLDTEGVVHDNQGQLSSWSAGRVMRYHQARLRLLTKFRGNPTLVKPILFVRHLTEWSALHLRFPKNDRVKNSIDIRRKLLSSVFKNYQA